MARCDHRRLKKNFPFGRNSRPEMGCKDCGNIIKSKDVEKRRQQKRKQWKRKSFMRS